MPKQPLRVGLSKHLRLGLKGKNHENVRTSTTNGRVKIQVGSLRS